MNFPRNLLVPTYFVGVLGAFLQISGGFWDVAAHIEGLPETFFTIQHLVLYAGVGLALLAGVSGLLMRVTFGNSGVPEKALLTGLSISLVGGALQIVAGPFDFWWHARFGFDAFLFTPAHTLLIAGIILSGVGMTVGATRLLQASTSGLNLGMFSKPLLIRALSIVSFTTLWLVLNGLVYLITDIGGIAYTFGLSKEWENNVSLAGFVTAGILLAGTGSLVLLTARRTLPWRGSLTMVALLGAGVTVLANLSFRASVLFERGNPLGSGSAIASFIPLYLMFLVPVVLFDLAARRELEGWLAVAAGGILGPFASYLDGFYSLALWMGTNETVMAVFATGRIFLVLALAVPMILAGTVAGLSRTRFTNVLLSSKIPIPSKPLVMRK